MHETVWTLGSIMLALVLAMFLLPGEGQAEGNCPPGYYPIGGQGTQGCAPIPNYNGGQQQPGGWYNQSAPPKPRNPPSYGAFAIDQKGLMLWSVFGKSKASAVADALQYCRESGGQDCRTLLTFGDDCTAMAADDASGKLSNGFGITVGIAQDKALRNCRSGGGKCTLRTLGICSYDYRSQPAADSNQAEWIERNNQKAANATEADLLRASAGQPAPKPRRRK